MASFTKPHKRESTSDHCSISRAFNYPTSYAFEIGEPHFVIEFEMRNGKVGQLELNQREKEFLLKQIQKPASWRND